MFTKTQKVWLAIALLLFAANLVVITILAVRMRNGQQKEKPESDDAKQEQVWRTDTSETFEPLASQKCRNATLPVDLYRL